MLTLKNREAIDWYLSADPDCIGNGGRSWQRVYGTKRIETAMASWSRKLRDVNAQAYLAMRRQELEDRRAEEIAYSQVEALRDLLAIQRDAMQTVSHGKVARKVKQRDPHTREETEAIEYADIAGMLNPAEAIKATVEAIRIQGQHPDQQGQGTGVQASIDINTAWQGVENPDQQVRGTGMQVAIDINTEWHGADNPKVVNTGDHAEPPELEGEPPPVVVIGRK